ncbi:MAG: hypothetical protein NVSMB27_01090 [Ktedonobacteraceae bacterium]
MSENTLPSPLGRQYRKISLFSFIILVSILIVGQASSLPAAVAASPQQKASRGTPCNHTGVTKNPDGSYLFSWLHVSSKTGYIEDGRNCIVDLHGMNSAGTEFGDGVSGFPGLSPARFTWFNSMFKMNYIRLNLNVDWWNTDVYVPNAQMHYQAWIQQWITWAKDSGYYVLLNRTNEYTLPPCGGSISYCPHQGELSDLADVYPQQQFNNGHLLDQTLPFWNSLVSLYRNDPAIMYNSWNELHDIDAQSWRMVQTTLIDAIRSINPRSVIMLGSNDWNGTMNPVVDGVVPDLNYPNLVYDWHMYDGLSGVVNGIPCSQGASYMWSYWGAESARQFTFAHSHGHGAVINEWGGCLDGAKYNRELSNYAARYHIGMAYYQASNVVDPAWANINSNGLLMQAAYAKFKQ